MTIRHLRIFVIVYELNSITKAGKVLHIAQPSISLTISELEKFYGVKLFDRINKRLYVTEEGKKLYEYANHIVSLFDSMENNMINIDSKGIIKIGTSITIGNYCLPKILSLIKKDYPMYEIKVIIDNTEKIKEYILENKIDIGLIEGFVQNDNLVVDAIKEDRLIPICSINDKLNGKQININDMSNERFLLREVGSASRNIVSKVFFEQDINICFESVSNQAIINCVKEGIGVSILPYLLVKNDLDNNEIGHFTIKGEKFIRNFCVIYHKNKYLSQGFRELIKIFKNAI